MINFLYIVVIFKGINTPIGVASYSKVQIQEIQKHLPTEEQIRQRIELAEREFNGGQEL